MNKSHSCLRAIALACAASAFALASAQAASTNSDIEATYQKERAACLNGQSQESQKTCLKEAAAARVEALRGGLTTPSPQQLADNAVLRCQAQPAENRDACKRMVRGEGWQEGSVAQGAVVRQMSTIEVAPAAGVAASAAQR